MKPAVKLEDIKDLQELVGEHAGNLEPGLQIVDSRVTLGGATIDLLALDASGTLTLIALGFVADDELLLRALEAYSWCLEFPDGVRRLYPKVKIVSAQGPRVIIIAEKLPDAFLRKARHLRFGRLDFFEFHFGILFRPLETQRQGDAADRPRRAEVPGMLDGAGAPAEPAARATAPEAVRPPTRETRAPDGAAEMVRVPRPDTPREPVAQARPVTPPVPRLPGHDVPPTRDGAGRNGVHAPARPVAPPPAADSRAGDLLNGLKLPDNGNLSPQWRQVLDRTPGELDDWKVKVVREYLQREFPTAVIYDFYAHDRAVQMFHLQDNMGAVIHTAIVAADLLADLGEPQIRAFLDKHKLARVLRQAGQAGVAVTKQGLRIESA